MQLALLLLLSSTCFVTGRHLRRDIFLDMDTFPPNFDIKAFIKDSIDITGILEPITKYRPDGKVISEQLNEDVVDGLLDGYIPPMIMPFKMKQIMESSASEEQKRVMLTNLFKNDDALLRKIGGKMYFNA